MTGIIASADDKAAGLQKKIQVLEVYAKRIEMPTITFNRITRFLENDIKDLNSLQEQMDLVQGLPPSLRNEVETETQTKFIK
jgi:hypothetical protein